MNRGRHVQHISNGFLSCVLHFTYMYGNCDGGAGNIL